MPSLEDACTGYISTASEPSQTHVARVAKLNSLEYLPHDLLDSVFFCAIGTAFKVIERSVVHKLKHKVEAPLAPKHLNQVHQIFMA